MFSVSFENMTHEKSFEYEDKSFKLSVWGNFFDKPDIDKITEQMTGGGYDFLNFDGGYVAYFRDKKQSKEVVFCSHVRAFDLFYIVKDGRIIFSDSFYALVSQLKTATWNLDSVSDYFEPEWNHICKYDRTPLKEISKLDTWRYIEIKKTTKKIVQRSWKSLKPSAVYTENNLDDFSKDFFDTLDYYLEKIESENETVAISLSAGIDTNTIAAEWSKKYPETPTVFFTSKIDDVTDESKMASFMQPRISSAIKYIPIKLEETNLIEELYAHMNEFVPPRFMNLLSERYFLNQLVRNGITMPYITGMGADGLFGEFGGEYFYLCKELLKKKEYERARNVYTAIQVSFRRDNKTAEQIDAEFDALVAACKKSIFRRTADFLRMRARCSIRFAKQCVKWIIRYKPKTVQNGLLRVNLPKPASSRRKSYKDAVAYAGYGGGLIDQSLLCPKIGLVLLQPYTGYRFKELSAKCDPSIFCDKVNKSCLRYAVRDLLPKEILENKIKTGQPGVTEEKVFKANKTNIEGYLSGRTSTLVNTDLLKQHVQNDEFGQNEFLALSLVVFEDSLKTRYNLVPVA